jgi:two-component system, cell cycle response regulator
MTIGPDGLTPPRPMDTFTVALEGLSDFERATLASFFRLAVQRSPGYALVDESGISDFLVADADSPAVVSALKANRRTGDAVFVGRVAPAGSVTWLPRPVDPIAILRELDALVELRLAPPAESLRGAGGAIAALDAAAAAGGRPGADRPPVDAPTPAASPLQAWRGGAAREVLVVEDSAIARKFLQQRLERLGYRVQIASSGEDALDVLDSRWFPIVFLDVVLGPPGSVDGLQVCQSIKQRAAKPGGAPTSVVLVTSATTSSDRVRGSLAGCDAYLTKPLMEREFIDALKQVDSAFEGNGRAAASAV